MKKLLLISALLGMGVAHAEYLNWMVGGKPVTTEYGNVEWTTAAFFQNGTQLGPSWSSDAFSMPSYSEGYVRAELNEGWSDASYLIELYNGDDTTPRVAWAEFGGSAIASHVFVSEMVPPGYSPFTPQFIPEPTSGMLFLLGGMLLGLKRRRQA